MKMIVDTEESISRKLRIDLCPVVQTNVMWPAPVDQRLNELIRLIGLEPYGEVSRSRLLAALVAHATPDSRSLVRLLKTYAALSANDVVLQRSGPISVKHRRPGRRPVQN
jgi:hypothetical protein